MSIVKKEQALKSKLRSLEKQVAAVQKELGVVEEIKSGDKPSHDQAMLMKFSRSFGVHFERRKALKKVRSPGTICKSVRRFGTRKEAEQHGRRFTKIHGHKGYKIVPMNSRPNAWINWRTGKTNPVLNK